MNKAQELFLKAVQAAERLASTPDAELELARARVAGLLGIAAPDYPAFTEYVGEIRARLAALANETTASEKAAASAKAK